MDQIQELLNILKETPQMALWGLGLYFSFILIKAASYISALAYISKLFITRFFNYKDKLIDQSEAKRILKYFDKSKISSVESDLIFELLDSIQDGKYGYIYESDIRKAIKKIKSK